MYLGADPGWTLMPYQKHRRSPTEGPGPPWKTCSLRHDMFCRQPRRLPIQRPSFPRMSSSRFPPSTHLQTLADLLGRAQSVLALVAARGVGRRARKTAFTLYVLRLFLVTVLVLSLIHISEPTRPY